MINKQALDEAIYEKYIRPIQRPRRLYAGLEFELPIVNLAQKPVDFKVIYALTDAFISRFGFDEIHRDDDGNTYSAIRTADGDGLSYDCSFNTLEFSFGVEKNLNVLYRRFMEYYTFIENFLAPYRHGRKPPIVYAPNRHVYFAALPGMWERTISCSSLSKTYSITGWRLGYTIAPAEITERIKKVHDFLTVGAAAPLQEAVVPGLRFGQDYYDGLLAEHTPISGICLSKGWTI